jgi:SAM-dependent methyltransferase
MSSTQGIQAEAPTAVFGPVTGDIYERQMGRWSQRLAEPFLDFVAVNLHGAAALDVGCGTGSLSFAMARRDPTASVTGCDISKALLAHSRAANPYPDRVYFEPGNACALPFSDNSFDLVLSSLVLMFVPDGALAAAEMARVAKPGGVVATATWDLRGGVITARMPYDTIVALGVPGAESWRARQLGGPGVRPGELATLWRAAGLRDVREGQITIRMDFANFADYWEPAIQGPILPGLLHGLSPEWHERVRRAIESAFLVGDADGPRSFAATAWVVAGIR